MTVLTALRQNDPGSGPGQLLFPESPLSRVWNQPLLLGLFLPIQAGGWSASTLERGTDWSFDYNAEMTLKAEELGFDLVFALAQWLPKGGNGGVFDGNALDAFMATASLLPITRSLIVISTIHVLYGPWHPLHLAKFGATLDHISRGRWGINIVTGHRTIEHEMFGRPRVEHDRRYEIAAEFADAILHLWNHDENASLESSTGSWRMKDAYVSPRPLYGRPIMVNATGSRAGIAFAARYSDLVFITSPTTAEINDALSTLPDHVGAIKQAASGLGREVRTIINPLVICRDTEKEAWDYAHAIASHADARTPKGMGTFESDAQGRRVAEGTPDPLRAIGGNVRVIGTPEQVVEQFAGLKKAGVDGVHLSFYDFRPELDYFGRNVLPLLKQAGLRS